MVSLAVLYTPYFYINSKEKYLYLISKYKNFIPLAISLAFLGIFFYSFLWKDDIISVYLLLPYLIHVFLIIIVNMITVGFLKDQKINNLIKNLIISITTGLVTLLIVVLFKLANGLLWAIPIQLLTFSLLPFFKKKRLFK
jgi:vacuolar-type H+-ATPase subunit I/STV1